MQWRKSQAITHELTELLTSNSVCTLLSLCRINAVEENDQNLWDIMNDTMGCFSRSGHFWPSSLGHLKDPDRLAGPVQIAQLCHLYSVENLLEHNTEGP